MYSSKFKTLTFFLSIFMSCSVFAVGPDDDNDEGDKKPKVVQNAEPAQNDADHYVKNPFPDEILQHIFSFLPIEDERSISLTSADFNRIYHDNHPENPVLLKRLKRMCEAEPEWLNAYLLPYFEGSPDIKTLRLLTMILTRKNREWLRELTAEQLGNLEIDDYLAARKYKLQPLQMLAYLCNVYEKNIDLQKIRYVFSWIRDSNEAEADIMVFVSTFVNEKTFRSIGFYSAYLLASSVALSKRTVEDKKFVVTEFMTTSISNEQMIRIPHYIMSGVLSSNLSSQNCRKFFEALNTKWDSLIGHYDSDSNCDISDRVRALGNIVSKRQNSDITSYLETLSGFQIKLVKTLKNVYVGTAISEYLGTLALDDPYIHDCMHYLAENSATLFSADMSDYDIKGILNSFLKLTPNLDEIKKYVQCIAKHRSRFFDETKSAAQQAHGIAGVNRHPEHREKFSIPATQLEIVLDILVPAIEKLRGKTCDIWADLSDLFYSATYEDGLALYPLTCSDMEFKNSIETISASLSVLAGKDMSMTDIGAVMWPIIACVNKSGNVRANTQFMIRCVSSVLVLESDGSLGHHMTVILRGLCHLLSKVNPKDPSLFASGLKRFFGGKELDIFLKRDLINCATKSSKNLDDIVAAYETLASEMKAGDYADIDSELFSMILRGVSFVEKDREVMKSLARILCRNASKLLSKSTWPDVVMVIVEALAALDIKDSQQDYIDCVVAQTARLMQAGISDIEKLKFLRGLFARKMKKGDLVEFVDNILESMAKFQDTATVTWDRSLLTESLVYSKQVPENLFAFVDAVLPHIHKILNLNMSFPNLTETSLKNIEKAGPGFTHDKQYFILNGLIRTNKSAKEAIRFIDAFVANLDKYCTNVTHGFVVNNKMIFCGVCLMKCKTANELVAYLNKK